VFSASPRLCVKSESPLFEKYFTRLFNHFQTHPPTHPLSPCYPFHVMATPKQLAANRRNARLSTGPRSDAGKTAAARNALKTGLYARGNIIGSESPAQLQLLEAQFTAEYLPATPTERSLVDALIHNEWLLRRYRWLETEVWNHARTNIPDGQFTHSWPGAVFVDQPAIARIHRMRNATQRLFRDTLQELLKLQAARGSSGPFPIPAPQEDDPLPLLQPIAIEPPSLEIGFVPSNRVSPPPLHCAETQQALTIHVTHVP
jgi:hypothetical protein